MPRKRKASKKVRARRLYKRLYIQLTAQHKYVVVLLAGQNMKAHLAAATRHTRLVARLCHIETLSGEQWDQEKLFLPVPRKRKASKKVRARRLYRRLYDRLLMHHNASIAALHAGDLGLRERESALFTKTIARITIVERLSGLPWDVDKYV